jgi:hydroxyacylglutathione hydrolase
MTRISREELKAKLDRHEDVKLVMVLNDWAFRTKHILGSLHFNTPEEALGALKKDDEIIVYCSGVPCVASQWASQWLEARGYRNVYYYAGGLADWEAAGYPLEGEAATAMGVPMLRTRSQVTEQG